MRWPGPCFRVPRPPPSSLQKVEGSLWGRAAFCRVSGPPWGQCVEQGWSPLSTSLLGLRAGAGSAAGVPGPTARPGEARGAVAAVHVAAPGSPSCVGGFRDGALSSTSPSFRCLAACGRGMEGGPWARGVGLSRLVSDGPNGQPPTPLVLAHSIRHVRARALGWQGTPSSTGSEALGARPQEAKDHGPDLFYLCRGRPRGQGTPRHHMPRGQAWGWPVQLLCGLRTLREACTLLIGASTSTASATSRELMLSPDPFQITSPSWGCPRHNQGKRGGDGSGTPNTCALSWVLGRSKATQVLLPPESRPGASGLPRRPELSQRGLGPWAPGEPGVVWEQRLLSSGPRTALALEPPGVEEAPCWGWTGGRGGGDGRQVLPEGLPSLWSSLTLLQASWLALLVLGLRGLP